MLLIPWAQRYFLTFSIWFSPGLSDAVETSTVGIPYTLHRETKIHHRLRFCCDSFFTWIYFSVLFDITSDAIGMELKWLMLNKHKRWFHSSRVKFRFVSMSASWFLVSMYLIWILGSTLILIKQPIKSNFVGSGNMSHCRASSLNNHLDYCFVVFKHIQQSFLMRRVDVWGNKINIIQIINLSRHFLSRWRCTQVSLYLFTLIRISVKNSNDQIPQVKRGFSVHPLNLHPRKWFLILLSCTKLKFVSYTSSWLEQTCGFRKYNVPPEVDCESSRSPAKSESWNSPNLRCHMTMLFEFTCVMNARNQTSQTFVACSRPFCNRTIKFVHRPWNIRSINSSQIQAFQNNLSAHIW